MYEYIIHKPLPARAQLVADVIGRERTLYLVRNWKKTLTSNPKQREWVCIYIPKKLPLDHELVKVMGWPDAEKLVRAFRGEILTLSNCAEVDRMWRNASIRRLHDEGHSTATLAEWFDMTDRQVRNVLKEMPIEATIH
jgi:hypothetical protein